MSKSRILTRLIILRVLALIAVVGASAMSLAAADTNAPHFGFIDSVSGLFGLSNQAGAAHTDHPAFSNRELIFSPQGCDASPFLENPLRCSPETVGTVLAGQRPESLSGVPGLIFDSFLEPLTNPPDQYWGSGGAPTANVSVTSNVDINRIATLTDLLSDGNLRFFVYQNDTLIFLSAPTPFADDGVGFKVSPTFPTLTLRPGNRYLIGAVTDVGGHYPYHFTTVTQGNVTAINANGRIFSYDGGPPECCAQVTFPIQLYCPLGPDGVGCAPLGTPPSANNISPPAFNEDTQSSITLSYNDADGDPATACAISSTVNVTLTTPCSCAAGVCAAGVTGTANYNGAASFGYTVMTNGQTSNTATATLSITPVNDAPTLNAIGNPAAILEDAGAQTVNLAGISAGPLETQTLSITASSNNTALIPIPTVTYTSPNAIGSLSYTPVPNANGSAVVTVTVTDNGGTANGGVNTTTRTFTVNVTAVNDAPTLNAIPDPPTILEDASIQTVSLVGITAGPLETQGLTVTASSNNAAVIPNPTVTYTSANSTGSLSYTPVPNVSGSALVTVTVTDDGDTANGGVNTTTRTFTVNVTPVNDAPTLNAIADPLAILEDGGAQTVNLAGITAGPLETQTLSVTALSNNTSLIPDPTVTYTSPNATGSLSYTPVPNANGSAVVTVMVTDNGGTANGGVITTTRTFTVNVTAVNDIPSFTKGADQAVFTNSGPQTVDPWATNISAGPANESSQAVSFQVTGNTNATLFSAGPSISPTGVLTYTTATNASGTATITMNLKDNGGTANGGVDTSGSQMFVINVIPVADVSITNTDNVTITPAGSTVLYNITATNVGPNAVTGAVVTDNFAAGFVNVQWTCTGTGGASCNPSGNGNISQPVNIPVGGTVTFLAAAATSPNTTGSISNTATIAPPAGMTDPNVANNTATDVDTMTAPSVFVIDDVQKLEGASGTPPFVFTVSKTGGTGFATSVSYQTFDGTAQAGSDYVAQSGTLNFGPNETQKTVTILVNGDTTIEPNETFFVRLANNPVAALIGDGEGLGTILNDDPTATPTPTPTPSPSPSPGFEGDINRTAVGLPGTGDGDVNVGDQIQYQRFLSGTDCPAVGTSNLTRNEQQRLDVGGTGGLAAKGDGVFGGADGSGIDAYARHESTTDFNPNVPGWQPTPAGGPTVITNLGCTPPAEPEDGDGERESFITTTTPTEDEAVTAARVIRLVPVQSRLANYVTVDVEIVAQGNEAGTQFGLRFDPSVLELSGISGVNSNPDIRLGSGAPEGTTLNVNAESAASGYIGIVENFNGAAQTITPLPSGTTGIVRLKFRILDNAQSGKSTITFDDSVLNRFTTDVNGQPLTANYKGDSDINIGRNQ